MLGGLKGQVKWRLVKEVLKEESLDIIILMETKRILFVGVLEAFRGIEGLSGRSWSDFRENSCYMEY